MVAIARMWSEFWYAVLFYTRPISDVLLFYIYRIFMGKTKPLPPIENKILLMSATELAEKIRTRQLKCEDVMRAYVDRARAVQPYINAIVDARYEDALEEARMVDRFLARGEKSPEEIKKSTPLLGVPFSCKEAIGVKGLAQTAGIYSSKGRVADKDSDAASLYRAAGAIPVTVTNVPELCLWWDTSNLIFGKTWNPYDNSRTVGGSSGGEGALITAAGALIGVGNDLGGSIRNPAAFNGIYGHKPSRGIISNKGAYPHNEEEYEKYKPFASTGPMCRFVEDLPLLLRILSGNDQRLNLKDKVNFQNVKIYYMESFPGKYLSAVPAVRESIKKAVSYFEEQYGMKPTPLRIDEIKYGMYLWECKYLETNPRPFKTAMVDESGKINLWWELFKSIFRLSNHTVYSIFFAMIERRDKDKFYYDCLKRYDKIEQKFLEIFKEDAIVLMPTQPEPPPYYHLTIFKYLYIGYNAVFNILGFPCVSIPAGMVDGLPLAIQVVSGHFKDHLTIAAAVELDKFFGGWKSPAAILVK